MELFEEDTLLRPRWSGQPERTYQPPEVLRCATAADAAFAEPERACENTRTATSANLDAGIVVPATGASMPIGNQVAKHNEPPATATAFPTHTAAAAPQPTPELPVAIGTESPSKGLHQDRQGRFRCDHCGGGLKVISSRPQDGYRLRRYQCLGCTERLTTVEVVVLGGINPQCSLDSAVARVMQNFVRRAPTTVLARELQRRATAAAAAAEPPQQ